MLKEGTSLLEAVISIQIFCHKAVSGLIFLITQYLCILGKTTLLCDTVIVETTDACFFVDIITVTDLVQIH